MDEKVSTWYRHFTDVTLEQKDVVDRCTMLGLGIAMLLSATKELNIENMIFMSNISDEAKSVVFKLWEELDEIIKSAEGS